MATIIGDAGVNDILTATGGTNSFLPLTSSDIMTGDVVTGGSGTDTLILDYSAQTSGIGIVSNNPGATSGSFSTSLYKVSYTSIERFNITGTGLADTIIGGALNDRLVGGAGDDVLEGYGGSDTIDGGSGDDILRGGDGNDTLIGGAGNDVLNGGNGVDTMTGGSGSDIYIVGTANDKVIEKANEGYDTVISSISISSLYANVEGLILTEGSNAAIGNGNNENNTIQGNSRDNTLRGFVGNDKLFGGAGKDTLLGGDGNDSLYGEDGDDILIGGLGSDRLTGGTGKDIFRFDVLDGSTDLIYNFTIGDDLIQISKSAFNLSLPLGTLSADNFVLGSRSNDANDFFVYNAANGKLSFDSDGSGSGSSTGIAILTTKPGLLNTDIRIIA